MVTEKELRRLGERCQGVARLLAEVHAEAASYGELDELTRRRELKQFALLQGALWVAASQLVEELFEEQGRAVAAVAAGRAWGWEQEPVCGGLPRRFAAHYTPHFVRQLVVAAGAVTARLTGEWAHPVSVLEEIALWLLIGQVQVVVDDNGIRLDPGWRDELGGLLFEDDDVQVLFDDPDDVGNQVLFQAAGEHYLPENWTMPFSGAANQAPYLAGNA
ncbi:hypothetical protein IT072_20950 (plasmid) [Leifsonia sp. ZF2019]|uniref:hypothetical protein n=1 Tax=Leifsonia sp. ZF2019 TaxID=2781978 RepID=UPI001CBF7A18|nr:hypothetical protein [Leifsonia sp. ZF2019]UAJ81728.1 hypothetical protein IT072_20950 [Leifsonia sp. ZF2019]